MVSCPACAAISAFCFSSSASDAFFSSSNLYSSTIDDSGNTYLGGRFYDYSNFKDNTTLNAVYAQGANDGYVAKYNDNGELQWVNTFGGVNDDYVYDIEIDKIIKV